MARYYEKANCKINLALDVCGKDESGYHFVDMVMTTLELHDEIIVNFDSSNEIKIISTNPNVPTNEDNICYKACMIMKDKFNLEFGARITIVKNVPIAAGLGGGSADAAAIIRCISKKFKISDDKLDDIFLKIGADVKFAMKPSTSRAIHFGEILCEIQPMPDFYVLLIKPRFDVYTKEIYSQIDDFEIKHRPNIDNFINSDKKHKKTYKNCYNVLQDVVELNHSEITHIKDYINNYSNPMLCMMSGSGPTVFALYDSEEHAKAFYKQCIDYFNYYDVILTKIYN